MNGARRIYLDNAATTRPTRRVIDHMAEAQYECFGNPSSPHAFGPPAKHALEDARDFLRGTVAGGSLVFTSGGSEADYLGIVGAAAKRPPGRVLMSQSDHPALLQCSTLLTRFRNHVAQLPVTEHGDIAPETLFDALGSDVRVVALMHGHNELGTLSNLTELIELTRRAAPEAHIHVDLVQTYGKLPFDFDDFDVDSIAVSGHKFHGPRGMGFLALAAAAQIAPLQLAGGQEGGLRGGTGETLMTRCDARGVAFSVGSACHSSDDRSTKGQGSKTQRHLSKLPKKVQKGNKPDNHVLAAIGLNKHEARGVVRLSFSDQTSIDDAEDAADIIADEAVRLLQSAPRRKARAQPAKTTSGDERR